MAVGDIDKPIKTGEVLQGEEPQQTVTSTGYTGYGGYGGYGSYTPAKQDPADITNPLILNEGDYNKGIEAAQRKNKEALGNIDKVRKDNAKLLLMKYNQINQKSDWQPNQQKAQSTYMALRRNMGNAANGSGIADLNEGMARWDDMQDKELIDTWKENQNNNYNNWYQANSDLIARYNEQIAETNAEFDNLYRSYMANIGNVDPEMGVQAYEQDTKHNEASAAFDKAKSTWNLSKKQTNALNALSSSQKKYNSYNSVLTKVDKYAQKHGITNALKKYSSQLKKLGYKTFDKATYNKFVKDTAKYKNAYLNTANKNKNYLSVSVGNKTYDLSTKSGRKKYATRLTNTRQKNLDSGKLKATNKNSVTKAVFDNPGKFQPSSIVKAKKYSIGQAIKTAVNKAKKAEQKAKTAKDKTKANISKSMNLTTTINKESDGSGGESVSHKSKVFQPGTKGGVSYLNTISNKASARNPNIPDSKDGATDYIRGTKEDTRSNKLTKAQGYIQTKKVKETGLAGVKTDAAAHEKANKRNIDAGAAFTKYDPYYKRKKTYL